MQAFQKLDDDVYDGILSCTKGNCTKGNCTKGRTKARRGLRVAATLREGWLPCLDLTMAWHTLLIDFCGLRLPSVT